MYGELEWVIKYFATGIADIHGWFSAECILVSCKIIPFYSNSVYIRNNDNNKTPPVARGEGWMYR